MLIIRRVLLPLLFLAATARAQAPEWAEQTPFNYEVTPNLTYYAASGEELKLDVYRPRNATGPVPVVMFIHGGGWVAGTKEQSVLRAVPVLAMGMAFVNVEYRLAKVAQAPAAVEDCRCALRWIVRNAEKYKFDVDRIVVAGASAGGHLALMTGMVTAAAGFDRPCPAEEKVRWTGSDKSEPKVAAIINWFGITDVSDMLEDGANPRSYAIEWIGNRNDVARIAARVSPLTYVRRGLPPILTIHGDADKLVPVSHARRLHEALQKAGATSELLIFPGAGHGDFNPEQVRQASDAVHAFLAKAGIIK
jgi:acetyl esterase/lipase